MKIKTWDKKIYIPAGDYTYWVFRLFIITIKAKTYNKTKRYVGSLDEIIKFIDLKW